MFASGAQSMRTLKTFFCMGLVLAAVSAWAQPYSVDWYKIAGGGGISTGGVYSVNGTIGQHDAGGPLSGGDFTLVGGFWSLISVVQTPGAPLLSINEQSADSVTVSWPQTPGWVLQQAPSLPAGPSGWTSIGISTYQTNNNRVSITADPRSGNRFFRLYKP
jgi:hypothetical protein